MRQGYVPVIVVLVVRLGVTPDEIDTEGDMDPYQYKTPEPDEADPMPMKVAVSAPPVAAGKVMVATGTAALLVIVQPPEVRATATRA